MKVLSLRLSDSTLKKIKNISTSSELDLTNTLRMLLKVSLDVSERSPNIPIDEIPEQLRSPEFMFLREIHRVKKGKK